MSGGRYVLLRKMKWFMCFFEAWSFCSLPRGAQAIKKVGVNPSLCSAHWALPSCWWLSHQGSLLSPSPAQITGAECTRAGRGRWGQRDNRAGLVEPCKPLSELWVLLWMWYFCQNDVEGRSSKRHPMFVPNLTSFSFPCPCPALSNMFPAGGERNQNFMLSLSKNIYQTSDSLLGFLYRNPTRNFQVWWERGKHTIYFKPNKINFNPL